MDCASPDPTRPCLLWPDLDLRFYYSDLDKTYASYRFGLACIERTKPKVQSGLNKLVQYLVIVF